jgi:predicted  nucleic acid-binding Zn-ribbon protein
MQTRHRIPTIFNLSMVDVLCCALGCVILLWLVNLREAKRRARAAGESGAQLVEAKRELASLRGALAANQTLARQVKQQLEETQSERDRTQQLALATKKDYDDTRAALDAALAQLASLGKDLKRLRTAHALITADLDKKNKDVTGLDARLGAASARARDLEKQLKEKKTLLATTAGQADTLASRLKDSASQVTKLEQEVTKLRAESKDTRDKLTRADTRATTQADELANLRKMLADANRLYRELVASRHDLEKQLVLRGKDVTDAQLSIGDLQREKKMLEDRIRIARLAADNRFAGISLTGRRVVFLVDMSGSMDLIDEQTAAPDKWPLLCETLAKIMKSLPDLTHYQVILFSDRVTYALGNPRRWLSYDKESSAKTVYDTLRKVKPEGGTNMAAAFGEAFQLRAQGMDTLYVFSDGLPNMGDGLPPGGEKLSETDKTAYCSKYVRQMLKSVWNRRLAGQPTVRINAIGFFFESPDVGAFLWAMCRENDGSFVGMSRP